MAAFTSHRKVVFSCEACGSRLIKRTSYLSHKFLRHDTYMCDNPVCGATYSGHTELTGIASPTGVPHAPPSELPPTPNYERNRALEEYRKAHQDRQHVLFDATNDPSEKTAN